MKIVELLSPEDVIRLPSVNRSGVLRALAHHAAKRLGLEDAAIARALADREAMGSTGVGHGIALPHARLVDLGRPFGVFAVLLKPIEFGAVDDHPVDLVFLLLLPAQRPEEHVRWLACAARRFKEPGLPDKLRGAAEAAHLFALLTDG